MVWRGAGGPKESFVTAASPNPSLDEKAKGSSRPLSKLKVSVECAWKLKGVVAGEEVRLAEWEIAGDEIADVGEESK